MSDADPMKECPICRGRGALRCGCWPGDCICGADDEPCDNCEGTGWIYAEEDEWEPVRALTDQEVALTGGEP